MVSGTEAPPGAEVPRAGSGPGVLAGAALSRSVVSNSSWPRELQPARLLCPWDSQARVLEQAAMPSSRGSSRDRAQSPMSPALQVDSLPRGGGQAVS